MMKYKFFTKGYNYGKFALEDKIMDKFTMGGYNYEVP